MKKARKVAFPSLLHERNKMIVYEMALQQDCCRPYTGMLCIYFITLPLRKRSQRKTLAPALRRARAKIYGAGDGTSTLARLHSTTELLPQNEGVFITDSAFRQAFFAKKENFFCRTRRGKALHRVRGCCTQQRLCCFSTCCVRIVRRVAPFFLVWGLSAVFVVVRLRREVNPA